MYNWPKGEYIKFKQNEFVKLLSNLPLNEKTKKFINHLKNNNCNIYIITGRNENKREVTENCKNLKIDYFFDDSLKVVKLLNKNNIKSYLIDEIGK